MNFSWVILPIDIIVKLYDLKNFRWFSSFMSVVTVY